MEWSNTALVELAIAAGWNYKQVLLYDEEGVEGWEWTHYFGPDLCEIGPWEDGPIVPDSLREILVGPTIEKLAKRKELNELANLLKNLFQQEKSS